ncbi:MAG: substrate-binding domain-containing protein [Ruminococcus sp.]|nr:substrate-binding domain-containing protein [uncultured Schaedlerella sp.]MCI9155051.1 substrate-binding domain-containing protein [Ruminococcus sp.]
MNAYLPRKDLPTAFFADNDLLECHAVQAFKKHGLDIPDDISVIGFDDRLICRLIEPQLATIAVSQTLFGPTAVDLLVTKLKQPRKQSLKVDIGTSLTERDSVRRLSN